MSALKPEEFYGIRRQSDVADMRRLAIRGGLFLLAMALLMLTGCASQHVERAELRCYAHGGKPSWVKVHGSWIRTETERFECK